MAEDGSLSFQACVAEMRRHLQQHEIHEPQVQEKGLRPFRPDERFVQCIWLDSLFLHHNLKTDSGKSLDILQPGRWNGEEGPDFRDAVLRIDGKKCKGDVEIHVQASGWKQHRHHLNSRYNNVILHAYLYPSDTRQPTRDSLGRDIESFVMEPHLFPDMETIRQTIQVEDYPYESENCRGRCQPLMTSLPQRFVENLLDSAGQERMAAKMERFAEQHRGAPLPQVFYQALMTYMGHGANKSLFFLLSKRAPLVELFDYLSDFGEEQAVPFFQSVLFHVARLMPEEDPKTAEDGELQAYVEKMRDYWKPVAGYFSDRLIPLTNQWLKGVRPVNFAYRRLGAMGWLLERCFLQQPVEDFVGELVMGFEPDASPKDRQRWLRKTLPQAFLVDCPEDFWAWRYSFHSRRANRAMKLLGPSRAGSIALNALLPFALLVAREKKDRALESKTWAILKEMPALDSNSVVRHMKMRLFGDHERGKDILDQELRQQGLFHIFRHCCHHNEHGCENCVYLEKIG